MLKGVTPQYYTQTPQTHLQQGLSFTPLHTGTDGIGATPSQTMNMISPVYQANQYGGAFSSTPQHFAQTPIGSTGISPGINPRTNSMVCAISPIYQPQPYTTP